MSNTFRSSSKENAITLLKIKLDLLTDDMKKTCELIEKLKKDEIDLYSEKNKTRYRTEDTIRKDVVNQIKNNTIDELKKRETNLSDEIVKIKKEIINLNKVSKKILFFLAVIALVASSIFVITSYYENQVIIDTTSHLLANYHSNYVIQDLKGDTVNTWIAWNIATGRVLHINVVNDAKLSQDKIDAIKDAISSTKTVTLDDSLLHKGPEGTSSVYYLGWKGALAQAYSQPTAYYIPQNFDINGTPNGLGDIMIILTNDVSPDGLSGFTKSIADGNEILKSKITIYSASEISEAQLKAIIRHEFGHAMGLAHSSAPEDLMHATIQTDYPYISGCDIDAVKGLYDGKKKSEVICQK